MRICKFLAAGTLLITLLWSPLARADDIALGTDYFQTQAGTSFDFGPGIGVVNFMGSPIGPGLTDTIVRRLNDITIGATNTIPNIQIMALSLVSTAPVNVEGNLYNVSVGLASGPTGTQDMGTLNANGTIAGGTFTSSLDVFFDAHFSPIASGPPVLDFTADAMLNNSGAPWLPTPVAGQVIVTGFDCDGPNCSAAQMAADQAANQHSGLSSGPGPAGGPPAEVDFFVTGPFSECAGTGCPHAHVVGPAPVPEPASLILLGFSFVALLDLRRRFKK